MSPSLVWDEKKKSLMYYYFTTAGFYTTGTMTINEGKFTSHDSPPGRARGGFMVAMNGIRVVALNQTPVSGNPGSWSRSSRALHRN